VSLEDGVITMPFSQAIPDFSP